ncbi:MAG TPA: hypothetical protein VGO47_12860 [Chlamydiales bacterium]|nr:hypothetical protein [Chlamydiales bacterium]
MLFKLLPYFLFLISSPSATATTCKLKTEEQPHSTFAIPRSTFAPHSSFAI